MAEEAKWYVVHTYSGYEQKVCTTLAKMVENRHMQDLIMETKIPTLMVTEIKDNTKRDVEQKLFPGYVLVKMIMTDDSWYVVRNTRGVTGFVGPGSKPVPLTEQEMLSMGFVEGLHIEIDVEVGDTVEVTSGAWEEVTGVVQSINETKQTVTITIDMFGRETPVEIGFADIKKI